MAVFTVTNTNDAGAGSLREKIGLANANADADTIVFQAGLTGTITLLGELALTNDVTIDGDNTGDNKADITLSGGNLNRIFSILGATTDVALLSLDLRNGFHASYGGAIVHFGASLLIANSTIADSAAPLAGAIGTTYNSLAIMSSTLSGNSAEYGGALNARGGSAMVIGTTFANNTSSGYGGAITLNLGANFTVAGSTITNNLTTGAAKGAAGIDLYKSGTLTIVNSVVAGNTAANTTLANDDIDVSVPPAPTININNSLATTTSLTLSGTSGLNLASGTAPQLGALADNGGPVKTMVPLSGSPLVGLGIGAAPDGPDLFVTTASDSGDDSTFGSNLAADFADGGGLSLREAINWAGAGDTIGFSPTLAGQTIRLQSTLTLSRDVTINGDTNRDGKANVTISGDANNSNTNNTGDVRIFSVTGSGTDVHLYSLTLTGGRADNSNGGDGGAVLTATATYLRMVGLSLTNNYANSGGGGVYANGGFAAVNSLFTQNTAGLGGALYVKGGAANLVNTTMTGNTATGLGGAIDTGAGSLIFAWGSTITGNTAGTGSGGAIDLYNGSKLYAQNSVISNNTASASPDIHTIGSGNKIVAGYSFLGTGFTLTNDLGHNVRNNLPGLLALADNGGPVRTMAPQDGSPLINAGGNTAVQTAIDLLDFDHDGITNEPQPFDARGFTRTVGTSTDIGAVELNRAPTPLIDSGAVFEDSAPNVLTGNVLTNDTDQDVGDTKVVAFARLGAATSLNLFSAPGTTLVGTYGTLVVNADGTYTYTLDNLDPDTNALYNNQFVQDVFSYVVQDGGGLSAVGDVVIGIFGRNDAPVAVNDVNGSDTVKEDVDPNAAGNVITNDTDVDTGDTRAVNAIRSDGLASSFVTVSTTTISISGLYGNLLIAADGSYTYSLVNSRVATNALAAGQTGHDIFTYRIVDTGGAPATAQLDISIAGTNDAPVANFDKNESDAVVEATSTSAGDAQAVGNVLTNDTDVDAGDTRTVNGVYRGLEILAAPFAAPGTISGTYGTLTINANGAYQYLLDNSRTLTNGIKAGETAIDYFTYRVVDSQGATDAAEIEIHITGANDAPVAVADTFSGTEDTAITFTAAQLLGNDTDAEGSTLSIVAASTDFGTAVLNSNGTVTFTPFPNINGAATFRYVASDGAAASNIGLVTVNLAAVNDAPIITAFLGGPTAEVFVVEGADTSIAVTTFDVDNDARTFSIVGGADAALFAIDSFGVLNFIAPPDFDAPLDSNRDNFYNVTVRATDTGGLFDEQIYTIEVANVLGNTITGSVNPDTINGSSPLPTTNEEDRIDGGAGDDKIFALGGNDTVRGGLGKDVMDGGAGRDTLDYADKTKPITLTLNGATPTIVKIGAAEDTVSNFENVIGGTGADKLNGDGFDNMLSGGGGNDALNGLGGADTLVGGAGNDKLNGDTGADVLDGGDGNDALNGGAGSDTLFAGAGTDTLTGGTERDFFVFNGPATNTKKIADMTHDVDIIQLDDAFFAAIGPTLEANEFIAGAKFTKALDADDRLIYDTKTGTLYYDSDGTGAAKALKIATLTNKPPLIDHEDFMIV